MQGVKVHHFLRVLLRTVPHAETGTSLSTTCTTGAVTARAGTCLKQELQFPKVLFIQVDGGPEGVSKALLALGELLRRLSIPERVEVGRLPVGHTHENTDALPGSLWSFTKPHSYYTPQRPKELTEEALSDGQLVGTRRSDKRRGK